MSDPATEGTRDATGDRQSAVESSLDTRIGVHARRLVAGLLITALVLRIVAAIAVDRFVQSEGRSFLIEGDANGYWELAQHIAAGRDYAIHEPPRYVLRTPGLPLLLAGSIRCFGDSILAARIVLAVIGTACCWLTYILGRRLHSRQAGFWAALFVAVNPFHVGNSVLILSETLFTFWMLLSLIALVRLTGAGARHGCGPSSPVCGWRLWLRASAVGAAIGFAVLARPGYVLWLAVAVGVVLFCLQRSKRIRLLTASGVVAGCFIVLLPWAARNASVSGHWVFTSLWSGPSLYDGLNPNADGSSNMQFFDDDAVMSRQQMSEYEMNAHYTRLATDFAWKHPGRAVSLAITKAGRFLNPVPNPGKDAGWGVFCACVTIWLFFYGFACRGLLARQMSCTGLVVTLGPFVLFLLVHMVFVGSVRYRLPVEFPLAVLTAVGWRAAVLKRGRTAEMDSATG